MSSKASQKDYLIVIILWALFQVVWYLCLGVEFGLESTKYIDEAHYILTYHSFSESRYVFYLLTTVFIAIGGLFHLGLYGALLLIMLLNLFAYLFFFRALKYFFGNALPAFFTVGLLMSFWPYQSWSLYLFTECTFYSVVLLLMGHLLLFQSITSRFVLVGCLLLLLLVISRPLGILFVLPTLLFVFLKLSRRQKIYFFLAGILFLVLLNFVVQIVFTTTSDWSMTKALTDDGIICNMPRNNGNVKLDLTDNPSQVYQLVYYVTHNFAHFTGLALIRLRYFFTLVRPYYSTWHNLYLIGYCCISYGSILFGLKRILRRLPLALTAFLFSSIFLFAAAIALQCDDYHNRFYLALTPVFILLTVVVWQPFIERVFSFARRRKS